LTKGLEKIANKIAFFRALSEAFKIDVPNVLHSFTSEEWIGNDS